MVNNFVIIAALFSQFARADIAALIDCQVSIATCAKGKYRASPPSVSSALRNALSSESEDSGSGWRQVSFWNDGVADKLNGILEIAALPRRLGKHVCEASVERIAGVVDCQTTPASKCSVEQTSKKIAEFKMLSFVDDARHDCSDLDFERDYFSSAVSRVQGDTDTVGLAILRASKQEATNPSRDFLQMPEKFRNTFTTHPFSSINSIDLFRNIDGDDEIGYEVMFAAGSPSAQVVLVIIRDEAGKMRHRFSIMRE